MHEVPDFPHERLVAVDHRLRLGPIFVESRLGHGRLQIADGLLALGDPGLQLGHLSLQFLRR